MWGQACLSSHTAVDSGSLASDLAHGMEDVAKSSAPNNTSDSSGEPALEDNQGLEGKARLLKRPASASQAPSVGPPAKRLVAPKDWNKQTHERSNGQTYSEWVAPCGERFRSLVLIARFLGTA